MASYAKALPRKRFFVDMFTRDIALSDCVLDLIDNSIDALIRTQKIDITAAVLSPHKDKSPPKNSVTVTLNADRFQVVDNCGGVSLQKAKEEIFNFGHSPDGQSSLTDRGIGAYGIGLKRAIFKIGSKFEFASVQKGIGFIVADDLTDWLDRGDEPDQWRFPLRSRLDPTLDAKLGGTRVSIDNLNEHSLIELQTNLEREVITAISRTYCLFLDRYVTLSVNNTNVKAEPIPLGYSSEIGLSSESYEDDGVQVQLVAGPARGGDRGEWKMERAGWYVLCNGRAVVTADKSELTGWGGDILPQFHSSKGRGFVGIASFTSKDPLKLPWTTTKRGLNRESGVYTRARVRMQTIAKPVYKFLESLYPSSSEDSDSENRVRSGLSQASLGHTLSAGTSAFTPRKPRTPDTEVNVQFRLSRTRLDAIRAHLRQSRLSAGEVGLRMFEYFEENEGLS